MQELEKLASRKLRISAKETMKIAEKLYTGGFISYPRTETNMFAKDIDLASMVENQTRDPNWGGKIWLSACYLYLSLVKKQAITF